MLPDVLTEPSMDLTSTFSEPKGDRNKVLKVKCLKEASLRGSKGASVRWCCIRKGSRMPPPPTLGCFSMEAIQETSEILIFVLFLKKKN